jgi:pyruvate-formate lyase-activating enzyme
MSRAAPDQLANLRAAYCANWTIWQSDAGAHYATRRRVLRDAEIDAGLAQTVAADDATALAERLRTQEGLLGPEAR